MSINELNKQINPVSDLALQYNNHGHAKYLQVQFDEAIEDYSKAIEVNSELGVAYFNRATVYFRLGDYKEALKDLEKAVALEPSNFEYLRGLKECRKKIQ